MLQGHESGPPSLPPPPPSSFGSGAASGLFSGNGHSGSSSNTSFHTLSNVPVRKPVILEQTTESQGSRKPCSCYPRYAGQAPLQPQPDSDVDATSFGYVLPSPNTKQWESSLVLDGSFSDFLAAETDIGLINPTSEVDFAGQVFSLPLGSGNGPIPETPRCFFHAEY